MHGVDVMSRIRLRETKFPASGFAVILAAAMITVDVVTWIELNVSVLYGIPLIVAASARSRRLLWGLALVLVTATFVVYSQQIPSGAFSLQEPFFVNRVLATAELLVTAVLLHLWMTAADSLDEQRRLLADANAELEAANRALRRRDEFIVRQNEELDRRRQDAEAASGRKTRLLRSMSHDIRSPIHAITVMAEVIRRTASDPVARAEIPRLTRRLEQNAASLSELVTNVLDAAAIESGQMALHASRFSLAAFLDETAGRLLPIAEAKGLTLKVEPPAASVWLETDQTKLMRTLDNLLMNAIKFTTAGEVRVHASLTPGGSVEITVRDTGVGIAPEAMTDLFAEFSQAAEGRRHPTSGWGLGLPICDRLVRLLGGTISVESKVGVGSVFTVRLPPSSLVDAPS